MNRLKLMETLVDRVKNVAAMRSTSAAKNFYDKDQDSRTVARP